MLGCPYLKPAALICAKRGKYAAGGEIRCGVSGTGAVPEVTLSAMGETRAQGPGEDEDRENYAELLMSSAPCSLCSGR